MKNSFFLVIPKQRTESLSLKEFEAKTLQHWLDDLPTANPGLATRLLHDFVIELNTIAMPSQLRLSVLERISPNVLIIENYLQSRLIKSGFPKDENENKIFEVLTSLTKECAIGYWTVLKELTHRDAGWFKGKDTDLALQRCIKRLGDIIINHFIMKVPVPDWAWIDLHSLYKLSLTINQNKSKVINRPTQFAKTHTPEACYHQILLLSLADPSGLAQKDIISVAEFIESIAPLLSLNNTPVGHKDLQCIILTDEDKAPYFQSGVNKTTDGAVFYLDFTKLYKYFEQHRRSPYKTDASFLNTMFGTSNQAATLPIELLYYLHQRWHGVTLQGSLLFADRLDRYITIGFPAFSDSKGADIANNPKADPIEEEFLVQSASDRLLSIVFKKTGMLSVGSLVSFRKKDEPEYKRTLGIVNKLNVINQSGKISFGVHLLANRFHTVICRPRYNIDAMPQKGVFYSIKSIESERCFIITDYFMFEENDAVELSMDQEEFPVIMKNRKNIGLGYWQFECQRIVEQNMPEQIKKGYDFI